MNLGNAFARRKQLNAEINTWIARLALAGTASKKFQTKDISGELIPIPGTIKEFTRNYTIVECRAKIDELIKEDQTLALRISMTNQIAKTNVIDLNGNEKEMTIPELLVLKNDIAPKIERALRAIPKISQNVEFIGKSDDSIQWRSITKVTKKEQIMTDKGQIAENTVVDYYNVTEVTDYGIAEREIFDEIDNVHKWAQRLKEAVNECNQTVLVDL